MDIGIIGEYLVKYLFGSEVLAILAFLFVIFLIGIRYNWSLDVYIIVLTPFMTYLSGKYLTPELNPLFLFGIGLVIGFALIALIRR